MNRFEAASLKELRAIVNAGGQRNIATDSIANHPLTRNDNNGPLITRPERYRPLPKLSAISFAKR